MNDSQSPGESAVSLPVSIGSGVLIVDKPKGVTSHDVVAAVRSVLHTRHVGHAGTLDPMATGLLVVGFGSATKLLTYITGTRKTYETTIRLGLSTTTDDADGEFLPLSVGQEQTTAAVVQLVSDEDIRSQAALLTGDIEQVPSTYSAKKVHGQKAYDMARNGQEVYLAPQKVTVEEFEVQDIRHMQTDGRYGIVPVIDVDARITCSAGTYIRSLGRDMGNALGTGGYLTRLRRLAVGSFSVDDPHAVQARAEEHTFVNRHGETISHPRAVLSAENVQDLLSQALSPSQCARRAMPVVEVGEQQADDLLHGRFIEGRIKGPAAAIYTDSLGRERLVAVVERRTKTMLKPSVVFTGA